LAALFFSGTVREFFRAAVGLFVACLSTLPRWFANGWQQSIDNCKEQISNQCIGQLGFGFFQALGGAIGDAARQANLASFPFWELILMLALAAFLAQLFDQTGGDAAAPESGAPIFRALQRLGPDRRQDLLLFLLLGLAIYLSIAAIAAIPGLEEKVSESVEVSVERLQKQITESPRAVDLKPFKAEDPTQALATYLGAGSQQPSAGGNGSPPEAAVGSAASAGAGRASNAARCSALRRKARVRSLGAGQGEG
jgi:hypothetical protein